MIGIGNRRQNCTEKRSYCRAAQVELRKVDEVEVKMTTINAYCRRKQNGKGKEEEDQPPVRQVNETFEASLKLKYEISDKTI